MMDCNRFDALLPDYLEETLSPALRAEVVEHLAACDRCRALADDVMAITRDAAALPQIEPSRDLWAGIAQRIEAPVVPLGTVHHRAGTTTRLVVTRRWLSAAAAVLVVASVGATYAVMRLSQPDAPRVAATETAAPNAIGVAVTPAATDVASTAPTAQAPAAAVPDMPDARPAARSTARLASATPADGAAPGVGTYDTEIRSLRAVLRRRNDLDSSTVAVIARSLRVIDDAIAQSRTALARDPHSRLLGDQLTRALDQKVELLRTAILLPASS